MIEDLFAALVEALLLALPLLAAGVVGSLLGMRGLVDQLVRGVVRRPA